MIVASLPDIAEAVIAPTNVLGAIIVANPNNVAVCAQIRYSIAGIRRRRRGGQFGC